MKDNRRALRPKRRIVIIGDEAAYAETLSAMVFSVGYDVTISTDARSSYTLDLTDDDIVAKPRNRYFLSFRTNSPNGRFAAECKCAGWFWL